jgi:hypothetical protein
LLELRLAADVHVHGALLDERLSFFGGYGLDGHRLAAEH